MPNGCGDWTRNNMKKTRFLWIRNIPDNCRSSEIRGASERHGTVQNVRVFKNGCSRNAVVAFSDTESAARAIDIGIKLKDTILKAEYCEHFATVDTTTKLHRKTQHSLQPSSKTPVSETFLGPFRPTALNGQTNHPLLLPKRVNSRVPIDTKSSNQVLRPVQTSTFTHLASAAWRGLKLSDLPPRNKLSDEHLRQGLFTEFRRCGRILSVVLPPSSSDGGQSSRVAIVTFRRPEEAESAYQAIHAREKLLFSSSVIVERHPGFCGTEKPAVNNAVSKGIEQNVTGDHSISSLQNVQPPSVSNVHSTQTDLQPMSKCPTRTLYIGGLTAGPTGPVTSEHLTAAFRKFGDILDVQLQCSSDSALIQFTEMRGPLRAMNAHLRDPLRLGGRPLFLAYVPSPPTAALWFSDLPPSLAVLNDEDLLNRLSQFAPIQEITLIARTDQSNRCQVNETPSTSLKVPQVPHYAAYVRLASVEHASRLLSEFRSRDQLDSSYQLSSNESFQLPRRLYAVDFASSRQTTLANSLRVNAARSGGSSRIRVISASTTVQPRESSVKRRTCNDVPTYGNPSSERLLADVSHFQQLSTESDISSQSLDQRTVSPGIKTSTSSPVRHKTSATCEHNGSNTTKVTCYSNVFPVVTSASLHMDHKRDTSPSSLSTTSSSSSLSSESSSSTSSSSSTDSSCSTSRSSTQSKSHRSFSDPSAQTKFRRTRSAARSKGPRNASTHPTTLGFDAMNVAAPTPNHPIASSSTNISKVTWTESTKSVSTRIPLSLASPTNLSSSQNCNIAGGGVPSPCTSCSSLAIACSSSNHTHPSTDESHSTKFPATNGHHCSTASSTAPRVEQFATSRISHDIPSSASSGVSSGSHSLCSNSSNDGSPRAAGLSQHNVSGLKSISSLTHCTSLKSMPSFDRCSSADDRFPMYDSGQYNDSKSLVTERKSRVYCSESSSGLRLHLSTNNSPTVPGSCTTAPLTLSIKLGGACAHSQNATRTSPYRLSSCSRRNEDKRTNISLPLTPLSAPPANGNLGHSGEGGMSSHSTDWVGSPVYESMYDKIKRRTNKEAEGRKQRQQQTLSLKEKKRRRRKKGELQLCKSPALNGIPYNTPPGSFGSENSSRTAVTNSSGKSGRSKSSRTKVDITPSRLKSKIKHQSKKQSMRDKPLNTRSSSELQPSSRLDRTWHQLFVNTCRSGSSGAVHGINKRSRRDPSPLSSLSSGDEYGSSSPPGTLTRLSLGMRFPVSATYHECVRPSKDVQHSKWLMENDGSLSRFSSVSFSGSDNSENRFSTESTKWSKMLTRFERTVKSNGHCARSRRRQDVESSQPRKFGNLDKKPHTHVKRTLNTSCASSGFFTDLQTPRYETREDRLQTKRKQLEVDRSRSYVTDTTRSVLTAVKKRHHDRLDDINDHKRQRTCTQSSPQDRRFSAALVHNAYKRHTYAPESYLTDDETILESENDYLKCNGTNLLTTNGTSFTDIEWSQKHHKHFIHASLHSITDESTPSITRSPSPMPCRAMSRFISKPSKCSTHGSSVCDDSIGQVDDDRDSVFDAFRDSDRYSTASKSTPSTEPMEQFELIERNSCLKFSDDEWHSSIMSTSPPPALLDFDVDYCPVDKTEQSSTTYQSTSFSSQMLSPTGKLASPTPDDSDSELHLGQSVKLFAALSETRSSECESLPLNRESAPAEESSFSQNVVPCDSVVLESPANRKASPVLDCPVMERASQTPEYVTAESTHGITCSSDPAPTTTKHTSTVCTVANSSPCATSSLLPDKSMVALPVSSNSPSFINLSVGSGSSPSLTNNCLAIADVPTSPDSKPLLVTVEDPNATTSKTIPTALLNLDSGSHLLASAIQHSVRKPHISVGDSSKSITVSLPSTKPPTDTHDITRYVQSVIERVKAEKVEETQQAASALHLPHGTSCSTLPSSIQLVRSDSLHVTSGTCGQNTSKRCGSAQKKPLLVAVSSCSATKTGINDSLKLSFSTSFNPNMNTAISESESTRTTESSVTLPAPLVPESSSSSLLIPTTDLRMPSIPGVNACTPLADSLASSFPGRMTRQQINSHLTASKRLDVNAVTELTSQNNTFSTTPSLQSSQRRRRRSEGRVTAKDPTQSLQSSLSFQSPIENTSQNPNKSVPQFVTSLSSNANNHGVVSNTTNSLASSLTNTSTFVKSHASVDPYEPNFDEESPPGFEHSQLHVHRATPPISSSPRPQPIGSRKSFSPMITSLAVNTFATTSPVTQVSSDNHNNPGVMTTVSTANVSDSVDEVIRDVCAGQFDVQSYLNSWRSDHPISFAGNADSPKLTTVSPITMTAAVTTISSSTASVKPFPLSLTSEPVVAAVTIPVTSDPNTTQGKNGPTNVNIGTGNALLNTLLAALQLIPGSQVTVTGPAAAAGVVGGIGTGTISATTITLPVNAARQAAANIKAAVLSATSGVSATAAQSANHQIKPSAKAMTSPTVVVSETPITCAFSTKSVPLVMSTTSSVTQISLTQSDSSASIAQCHYPKSSATRKSDVAVGRIQRNNVLPLKVSIPSLRTTDSLPNDLLKTLVSFSESSMTVHRQTKNQTAMDCVTLPGTNMRSPPSTTFVRCPVSVPSTSGANHPSICTTQLRGPTTISSLVPPAPLSGLSTYQPYGRLSGHVSSASLTTDRNTPLSSSFSAHTIQTLADRLVAVDPSVLVALAQSAVGGANLSNSLNENTTRSETEVQVFHYLQRLVHQLNELHATGSSSKHFSNNKPVNAQNQSIHTTTSTSFSNSLLAQLNQHHQRFPLSVSSSLYGNTLSSDAVLAATTTRPCMSTGDSVLISPPVMSSRPTPVHTTSNVVTTTPFTDHTSANTVAHTYPLVWEGRLSLKNAETRVALHYVYGNPNLLHDCMRLLALGGGGQSQHSLVSSGGPLRIVQRMRLEISQLEGVQRKIYQEGASCVCLALPAGHDPVELMQQTQILNDSFIRYMQEKMAAGIINVGHPNFQQGLYVVHIFPPCEFSHTQLNLAAPDLHCRVVQANQSHLLVVITTV